MPTSKKTTTARKTAPKKKVVKKEAETSNLDFSEDMKSSKSLNKLEVLPKRTKLILILVVCAVLIGIIVFLNRSLFIAGLVNGEPISRLEVLGELEKQQGTAVLNRLIDRKLILQEAEKKNLEVTQDEINAKRTEIVNQVSGGDENNFNQILTSQGLTPEQFIEELRVQLLVEKMLSENTQVTDEEFNQFIESNPDLLENAENEEQARAQLRDQLQQQKLQTEYLEWLEGLRNNGNIVRFVNY